MHVLHSRRAGSIAAGGGRGEVQPLQLTGCIPALQPESALCRHIRCYQRCTKVRRSLQQNAITCCTAARRMRHGQMRGARVLETALVYANRI